VGLGVRVRSIFGYKFLFAPNTEKKHKSKERGTECDDGDDGGVHGGSNFGCSGSDGAISVSHTHVLLCIS
jgi:hypothetical protein